MTGLERRLQESSFFEGDTGVSDKAGVDVNPVNVILVEDSPLGRKSLERMLRADPEIRLVSSCADGRRAVDSIKECRPELAIIDIELPHLDGFALLNELEPAEKPLVIFITGKEQYAVRAFEVSAVDYLLKPFTTARFELALSRGKHAVMKAHAGFLSQQVEQLLHYAKDLEGTIGSKISREAPAEQTRQLVLKANGALHFTKSSDVIWIEAQGDFVKVQTGTKTQLVRETLQNLELKLDASKFLRIHRSFLVNLDQVDRVETANYGDYSVFMSDGSKLPLSRNYRAKLKALITRAPASSEAKP
jgi:two-component system LytT family response regulator